MKRKLITFDWAIKRLLRSKANFGILEGFLTELLKQDITILEVLESEGKGEGKAAGKVEANKLCSIWQKMIIRQKL